MSLQQFLHGEGRFNGGNDDTGTGWLDVGELDLDGPLWIGDPYTVERESGFIFRLPSGSYSVAGRGLIDDQGYPRVSRLRLVNKTALAVRLGEKVGVCGTDTAMVALCDIDEVDRVRGDVGAEEIRERVMDAADDGCGTIEIYPGGEMLRLVFTHTGFGDGTFPVFALRAGAKTVGVELEFIS